VEEVEEVIGIAKVGVIMTLFRGSIYLNLNWGKATHGSGFPTTVLPQPWLFNQVGGSWAGLLEAMDDGGQPHFNFRGVNRP
jgi:hypothetical protein